MKKIPFLTIIFYHPFPNFVASTDIKFSEDLRIGMNFGVISLNLVVTEQISQ